MNQIALPIDPSYISQIFTIDMTPNDRALTLRIRLDYREYIGKYFMSVTNVSTGEDILVNFPIVASEENALNDLIKQVAYKRVGSLICYPLLRELIYPDPSATIFEFELIWGDSPWIT